jgi:hypothetical protein
MAASAEDAEAWTAEEKIHAQTTWPAATADYDKLS